MVVSHLGAGLLILGITASSIWQEEKIVKVKLNDEIKIKAYSIVFKEINEIKGPNYIALRGKFNVYNYNKNIIAKTPKPLNITLYKIW